MRIDLRLAAACGLFAVVGTRLPAGPVPDRVPRFTDVTKEAGIRFAHEHGGTGEKYMCETMGGGVAFLDMDGDGDLDLLFVQSGPLPDVPLQGKTRKDYPNHLYENVGGGEFRDVTAGSGIEGKGYGMGAAVGDVDGDGLPDVYLTSFGPDELYRNLGGGKWKEVTKEAGIGNALWGSSAAFADLDADGFLDLYVTNYLDFTMKNNVWCGERKAGMKAYCHPDAYGPLRHVLYRNKGNGTFEDVTKASGVDLGNGKGLGVVAGDYDGDGLLDLYVANDSTGNFLFHNVSPLKGGKRQLKLQDETLLAGVGFSETGKAEAGMGVDMGDADGDGKLDLFVTNLDLEPNELFINRGDGTFRIATYPAGVGEVALPFVGWGTGFVDYDNDGDLDMMVGNGHIIDNIHLYRSGALYAQRKLLHLNRGNGIFDEVGLRAGDALARPEVTRGMAFGDYYDDGDVDVAVCNNDAPAVLLRNDGPADRSITLSLKGKGGNRQGLGARVTAEIGGKKLVREARTAYGYQAASDPRVHLGLGKAASATKITVKWLSGKVSELRNVAPGKHTVEEP